MTHNTRPAKPSFLTLDHIWIIVALTMFILRPLLTPIPPNDFWWHMATGRLIIFEGGIPALDSFSFTQAGVSFYNQSWLSQVLMYGLYQLGNIPLVLLVQASVITGAYGLLLWLCIKRTQQLRLSVVIMLIATLPLSFDNWVVRPQSYVLPFFVVFLTILTAYRLGWSNRLWVLPLVMVLWVNMHGSFVLGLALMGIIFVGEALKALGRTIRRPSADDPPESSANSTTPVLSRQYLLWGSITALTILINPQGFGVLGYVRDLLESSSVTSLVTEWASPTIRDTNGLIFFVFLIGCGAILTYARRHPDLTDVLLFAAFLWLALGASRNIVWFGFVATPLIAVQAATFFSSTKPARQTRGSPFLNRIIVGLLVFLIFLASPWIKPAIFPPSVGALLSEGTPTQAVTALHNLEDPPQRLFHEMGYGSYLIWEAPDQPVFIDPRIELYPFDQWVDYINLGQANNVAQILQTYAIDGLLLSKEQQSSLVDLAQDDPAWQNVYEDEFSILFTKQSP
ncbi:MAG: hypothetical protein AAGF95_17080 [Chloroflexota bacterium]